MVINAPERLRAESKGPGLRPSERGISNLTIGRSFDLEKEVDGIPEFDKVTCPDGLIDLSGAGNFLMGDFWPKRMEDFQKSYDLTRALRYGPVPGPPEFAKLVSEFITERFQPAAPVLSKHILTTNGVSSLIDNVIFNMCNANEGVLVATPTYSMFPIDLCSRGRVQLIEVPTDGLQDPFGEKGAKELIQAFEDAHLKASRRGIRPKVVLLCNPCNPVGRSYSKKTLVAIARFCGRHSLSLLADEIYALSGFKSQHEGVETFTSVLTIPDDPKNGVYKENIHSMYGVSKDFGLGGLRLGFFVTRNQALFDTCRRIALFTWLTPFSTAFFSYFLKDRSAVDEYLGCYRGRLESIYLKVEKACIREKIPFDIANSGLFIFIKCTKWLKYFDSSDPAEVQEMKLARYLAKTARVLLSTGGDSLSATAGCFRFVYTVGEDHSTVAVERIGKALRDLESSGVVYPISAGPALVKPRSSIDSYSFEHDFGKSEDWSDWKEGKKQGTTLLGTIRRTSKKLLLCNKM